MSRVESREGGEIRGEDWYGEVLEGLRFVDVTFDDVDLTEATTRGVVFEHCVLRNCRLNVSTHVGTAFVACELRRTSLFGATLEDCKLSGTVLVDCMLPPLSVRGGRWDAVTLRGADLRGVDLSRVDLREADLAETDLTGAVLTGADLQRADRHRTARRRPARRGPRWGGPVRRRARPHPAGPGRRRSAGRGAGCGRGLTIPVGEVSRRC